MKLFNLFATSSLIASGEAEESGRIFIDEEPFWSTNNTNFKLEEQYLNDQLLEINSIKSAFFRDWPSSTHKRADAVKSNLLDQFSKLQNRVNMQTSRCFPDFLMSDPIRDNSSDIPSAELTSTSFYTRFHANYARKMAIYIRQVFSVGSNVCQKQGLFLIRRLERLRLITFWQYCDKIDENVTQCSWAYKDGKTGATRLNPRKLAQKDEDGNNVGSSWVREKFGKNVGMKKRAVVCDVDAGANEIEQKISCDGDGRITIQEWVEVILIPAAIFGRLNNHECLGDFPRGHFEICEDEKDVQTFIETSCQNQQNCTVTTDLVPEDHKTSCSDTEKYLLVHYSCE